MHFNPILFSLLGIAHSMAIEKSVPAATANELFKRDAKCFSGPSGFGHTGELNNCVQDMVNNPNWGQWDCAGRSFFLGGSAWDSPGDCVGGCKPCLFGATGLGLEWMKCDQKTGVSAHCWVGWCPPGQSPGGNSDGSCS